MDNGRSYGALATMIFRHLFLILLLGIASSVVAQTQPTELVPDKATLGQEPATKLEERIAALEEELEKQKHGKNIRVYQSIDGLGPAASQVYHATDGFTLGGYGEVNYNRFRSDRKTDQLDVLRFVLYSGYRFNDWIVLNTEIEYEHTGNASSSVVTDVSQNGSTVTTTKRDIQEGEVYVEFAYIDFKFYEALQLKLGLNLVPVGLMSYMHEPTTFYSVDRPITETNVIPSTWRDVGAIVTGDFFDKRLTYRTGILDGPRGKNFSESSWIRGGRMRGSRARAEDFAAVINVDTHPLDGLLVGSSFYKGYAGQDEVGPVTWKDRVTPATPPASATNSLFTAYGATLKADTSARVPVQIAEAHYLVDKGAFTTRGVIARGWLSDAGTRALNKQANKNIAKEVEGGYLEGGVNVLHFFNSPKKLVLFVRGEYVNTQRRTIERYPGGKEDLDDLICANLGCLTTSQLTNGNRSLGIVAASDSGKELYGVRGVPDRTQDRRIYTMGMAFYPHENITLKLDYAMQFSKSDYHKDIEQLNPSNNKIDQVNFGLGFIF